MSGGNFKFQTNIYLFAFQKTFSNRIQLGGPIGGEEVGIRAILGPGGKHVHFAPLPADFGIANLQWNPTVW